MLPNLTANPDLYDAKKPSVPFTSDSTTRTGTKQLGDFYRTDVDVPADLIVDGKVYQSVGVRFRGSSSYFTVQNEKKSFNIAVDHGDDRQRLYGYKTLNLFETVIPIPPSSAKSSILELLPTISPAPKANFVKTGHQRGKLGHLRQ